jgi:hypothetical protein
MAKGRDSAAILFVVMLFGALIGSVLGEILGLLVPGELATKVLTRSVAFGLDPPGRIDLKILTFTLGFSFRMNLISLLGIFLATFVYKKI